MMILIFNFIGLIIIGLIIWWFWISKSKPTIATSKLIKIEVKDGVYSPARIKVKPGQSIIIEFNRRDYSACSEYVSFPDLDIHEKLPINKPHPVKIAILKAGKYPFSCQMGMYQGELIVSD